jgi:hypothetical protein
MNATGVLGLVPMALWPSMPWYDSGIPNEWRLYNTVRNYFDRFRHERIVVFSDYYAIAIQHALDSIRQLDRAQFVLEPIFRCDYENLLSEHYMRELVIAIDNPEYGLTPFQP